MCKTLNRLQNEDKTVVVVGNEKLSWGLIAIRDNIRSNACKTVKALSAIVIGALVIGAITGVFSLPIAVLGHEISEFIVIGSGLRMLRR